MPNTVGHKRMKRWPFVRLHLVIALMEYLPTPS